MLSKVGETLALNLRINIVFGNNIKHFRYKKQLTQEEVAEMTESSVTYISQLELGHHSPSFDKLESLADALEVEPFEFYVNREFKKLPPRVDMTRKFEKESKTDKDLIKVS